MIRTAIERKEETIMASSARGTKPHNFKDAKLIYMVVSFGINVPLIR
jgi:hypothetical protein